MPDVTLDLSAIVNGAAADANPIRTALLALQTAVNDLDTANLSAALAQMLAVPGEIKAYAGAAAPAGYLLCDGAPVSRTTYAGLFAVTGTVYGVGDNSTTFNLPDLRGRVPVGVDGAAARMTASDALGNQGGAEKHTLTIPEMPAHDHAVGDGNDQFMAQDLGGAGNTLSGAAGFAWNPWALTNSRGGGGAHNNMPPYQIVNYVIKT